MSSSQKFSTRRSKTIFVLTLVFLTVAAVVLSLWIGSVKVTSKEVFAALTGQDKLSTSARIILYSRMPRTCAALLSGAALAVSGMVIQTVLNNPLASPGIIGVNSGAGFAVALICALMPTAQRYTPYVAFAGALLGVLLIMILSKSTGAARITVVLAGVAISNLFSAGIDAVVTFVPDALNGVTDHGAACTCSKTYLCQSVYFTDAVTAIGYSVVGKRYGTKPGACGRTDARAVSRPFGSVGRCGSQFFRFARVCRFDRAAHHAPSGWRRERSTACGICPGWGLFCDNL